MGAPASAALSPPPLSHLPGWKPVPKKVRITPICSATIATSSTLRGLAARRCTLPTAMRAPRPVRLRPLLCARAAPAR